MPTGYTAEVGDGKVTDFNVFAMQCARAFGALITMRDDPADAAIPAEFAPSDYHVKALAKAREALASLRAMSIDQRQVAADTANAGAVASWDLHEAKKAETRKRYDAMVARVKAWTPPTGDHVEMKNFMLQQLSESIRFDCGPAYSKRPSPLQRDEWFAEAVAKAEHDIDYHTKEHAAEVKRCAWRSAWIADLRRSLQQIQK